MKTNDLYRPKLHYTAESGWINDPNGFSLFGGEYHLFAQHNPHDTKWGPMHWSHAKSSDMITWEHLPIALAPEHNYEQDLGCFSGTALSDGNRHILMYTGCAGEIGKPTTQTQCIAIGDGKQYKKLEQNPVISVDKLPDHVKSCDFRDPKLFRHDGYYYALMGAQDCKKQVGCMLLYKSVDLIDWQYVGETLRANESGLMGIVFECPDLFRLGDKYVILTSPINMPSQGDKYRNLSSAVYFVGDMDFETGKFTPEFYDEIDGGFDFYAPQTLQNGNSERIMIAWAQMWERNFVTDQLNHGWVGSMSLPRKLTLKDNILHQKPIETLERYYGKRYNSVNEGSNLHFRLKLEVDLSDGREFLLQLLKTSTGSFDIRYNSLANELVIDRSNSLFRLDRHPSESDVHNVRKIQLNSYTTLKLDIVVDNSVVEVFVNDGRFALTSNYYYGNGELQSALNTNCKTTIEKIDLE